MTQNDDQVLLSDLTFTRRLGEGAFATVDLYRLDPSKRAMTERASRERGNSGCSSDGEASDSSPPMRRGLEIGQWGSGQASVAPAAPPPANGHPSTKLSSPRDSEEEREGILVAVKRMKDKIPGPMQPLYREALLRCRHLLTCPSSIGSISIRRRSSSRRCGTRTSWLAMAPSTRTRRRRLGPIHPDAIEDKAPAPSGSLAGPAAAAPSKEGDNGALMFLQEYCDGGSLLDQLRYPHYSALQALKWIRDVAAGMAYLHSKGVQIAHRDLKLENILLSHGVAKVADFGLSRLLIDPGAEHADKEVAGSPASSLLPLPPRRHHAVLLPQATARWHPPCRQVVRPRASWAATAAHDMDAVVTPLLLLLRS